MLHATHVVLLVVDGLRPDALSPARTPEIDRLAAGGAFCAHAQAVIPSITLPCHASMLCGVPPQRHGVLSNVWLPPRPPVPSLIDLVHHAGLGTASFFSWEELRDLSYPGSLDFSYYRRREPEEECELEIGAQAGRYFTARRPALSLVYLGMADDVAHDHGWMSARYLRAVAAADQAIGLVRRAVQEAGCLEQTAFLVLADHGGHGFDHAEGTAEDVTIPWIGGGAGFRRGHRIETPVSIVDTAPTLAHLLGLSPPVEWSGRPVWQALEP